MQRGHKRQYGYDQGKQLNVTIAARDEQNEQPADSRNKRHQRKNDGIEAFHIYLTPTQTMYAITTAPPAAIQPAYERKLPDCICRAASDASRAACADSLTEASITPWSTPCQRIVVDPSINGLTKSAA